METQIRSFLVMACAISAGLLLTNSPAQASYIVTMLQVGPDVVATGSGAINTMGLSGGLASGSDNSALIKPNSGAIFMGTAASVHNWGGFSGPLNFGSGGFASASSFSGDHIALIADMNLLNLPSAYVSESPLMNTGTYGSSTFASLGVNPGTYVWSWGAGPDQSFTLQIGAPATVPESGSSYALLLLSLAALYSASRYCFAQSPSKPSARAGLL